MIATSQEASQAAPAGAAAVAGAPTPSADAVAPADTATPSAGAPAATAPPFLLPSPVACAAPPAVDPLGTWVLHISPDALAAAAEALRDDGFGVCVDVCAVDYLGAQSRPEVPPGVALERFEVVVTLLSHFPLRRVRIRVQVPDASPRLPTLCGFFPGAENPEREVFDLFGISFDGHPDLTRILMPTDWVGHPLRKDYDVGAVPVRFKATGDVQ